KKPEDKICLTTIVENSTLWHRRLGHANMRLIQSLASKELVRNLPKLKIDQHFCDAFKIGKQAHASHKVKNIISTARCLELLYMDLFGPSAVRSHGGNLYTLVIVDDYSRYTWTRFLKTKTEAIEQFEIFSKKVQNQIGYSQNSKACIILNKHTVKIKETLNVTFDETPPPSKISPLVDDDLDEEEAVKVTEKKILENDIEDETLEVDKIVNIKEFKNHPLDNVIENLNKRTLRNKPFLLYPPPEAEYVSARKACQQELWMKQALIDYDIRLDDIPIMCDNKGAIDLRKNPMQQSRTNNIEICHHFLRDNVQKGHISIEKVMSEDNIANIITKPLKRESFNYLRLVLGMMKHIP
nr:retrovirus-related Pol polyprotein from transposon TNT 1-94 [Tanacetum cinerariifolium]